MESVRLWTVALCTLTLAACSLELKKDKDADNANDADTVIIGPLPSDGSSPPDGSCYDCQDVPVMVHYALTEDLGASRQLTVEAFGNDQFQGAPLASTVIGDFRAQFGEWQEVKLRLGVGEFFIRAYLTTATDTRVPYPIGGMEPVEESPLGVFGAVSSPKAVHLYPSYDHRYGTPDAIVVSIDRLYRRPGSEPETNAKLRVELKLADGMTAPDQKRVLIQLRTGADLDEMPRYAFELSSSELRVAGREGEAELVTPSLAEGNYTVFAFIDADANGFYDDGELAALAMDNGQPKAVAIAKNHVRSLKLELNATPTLP